MKQKLSQTEILEMMKMGWGLFRSRCVGSYPGHWYMKKDNVQKNVNAVPIEALVRRGKIIKSLKPCNWSAPREYVIGDKQ